MKQKDYEELKALAEKEIDHWLEFLKLLEQNK